MFDTESAETFSILPVRLAGPALLHRERRASPPNQRPDLVRDHVQAVLALIVPDHVAQVGHARDDLRRHPTGPPEQPAPAQGHKAPVQGRGKEFIDEPERMPPLIETHIRENHHRPDDRSH